MSEPVLYVCDICSLPIEGEMIGHGDGSGKRFAHPYCYWREKAKRIKTLLENAERTLGIYADRGLILDVHKRMSREWDTDHQSWIADEFCENAKQALKEIQNYMAFDK